MATVKRLVGVIVAEGYKFKSIDFSGSRLDAVRFSECELQDCVFDECSLRGVMLRGCRIDASRFCRADLREAFLGGTCDNRRTEYLQVHFTECDMRRTMYKAALFADCAFENCRIESVDFQSTQFVRTRFVGELSDVLFYKRGFKGECYPANEMDHVDMSCARLHDVEFRSLDLNSLVFPTDGDVIVVDDYRNALQRLKSALQERTDKASSILLAMVKNRIKWAGANQRRGMFSRESLIAWVGEERVEDVIGIIRALSI